MPRSKLSGAPTPTEMHVVDGYDCWFEQPDYRLGGELILGLQGAVPL